MAYSKKVVDVFSEQIEKVKFKQRFETYIETLEFVIEEKYYDFITHSNAGQFCNKQLKNKLLLEASTKRLIDEKHKKLPIDTLF